MSLRDADAVDYIGINILFKRVYVGLFDDLDWRDEQEHQDLLTRKIDRYIRYIRSGKLLLNYPKVRGYEIVIEYVSMHRMPPAAHEYWKSRERLMAHAGYKVHTRGVDVRHALGVKVEEAGHVEVEHVEAEPVEPPALEVLDPDPEPQLANIVDISCLPPALSDPRRLKALPVLRRLAIRRAAGY
jgi:hypothetical protein